MGANIRLKARLFLRKFEFGSELPIPIQIEFENLHGDWDFLPKFKSSLSF